MDATRLVLRSTRLLFAGALLIAAGCGSVAVPNDVPPVDEHPEVKFDGAKVSVVSLESDDKEFDIYASKRFGTFRGNKKTWCDELAKALGAELARRGATVDPDAKSRIQLTLGEITGHSGYATIGFKATARLQSPTGWA